MAGSEGTATDGADVVTFVGGVGCKGHFVGFRGSGAVLVGKDGIEFRLNEPLDMVAHRYVKRSELATVYPVQARRPHPTWLRAAIISHKSNTGVRFLTPAVGMFADRDVYTCFPDHDGQPQLIDLLEELGYPVDRTMKTYRSHWSFEA